MWIGRDDRDRAPAGIESITALLSLATYCATSAQSVACFPVGPRWPTYIGRASAATSTKTAVRAGRGRRLIPNAMRIATAGAVKQKYLGAYIEGPGSGGGDLASGPGAASRCRLRPRRRRRREAPGYAAGPDKVVQVDRILEIQGRGDVAVRDPGQPRKSNGLRPTQSAGGRLRTAIPPPRARPALLPNCYPVC